MKRITAVIAAGLVACAAPAFAGDTPAPKGAEVYFVNLSDGATVEAPVTVVFGLKGMGDMNHVPHDPPVTSEVITITVE